MEQWASRQRTIETLLSLGFTQLTDEKGNPNSFFDSPKNDWAGPVVQVSIYQCRNNYWCVDADGGWRAPVVWDGPKVESDHSDSLSNTTAEFVSWLDSTFAGWR